MHTLSCVVCMFIEVCRVVQCNRRHRVSRASHPDGATRVDDKWTQVKDEIDVIRLTAFCVVYLGLLIAICINAIYHYCLILRSAGSCNL